MKRLVKILFYFFVGIVVLIAGLIAFTQTGYFRDWLRDKMLEVANESINGQLQVASLSGNLFTQIRAEGIELEMDGTTVAEVNSLSAEYNPLSLFSGRIIVRKLEVDSPFVFLARDRQDELNLSKIAKPSEDTTATVMSWTIELPKINILDGAARFDTAFARKSGLPAQVRDLNLTAGFWMDTESRVRVALENLNFATESPHFEFRTIQTMVEASEKSIKVSELEAKTAQSAISGSATVNNLDAPTVQAELRASPVSMDEIRNALPELNLYGNPRIELAIDGNLSSMSIKTQVQWGQGTIYLAGRAQLENEPYGYDVRGAISQLNLAELMNDSSLASNLNVNFDARGTGVDLTELIATATVDIDDSWFAGYRLETAHLECKVKPGRVDFKLDTKIKGSLANLSGTILNPEAKNPSYDILAKIKSFDISEFDTSFGLASDLNLESKIRGRGFDPNTMTADGDLTLFASTINDIQIDSAGTRFSFDRGDVKIDTLALVSPIAYLNASGNYTSAGRTAFRLRADIKDLAPLSAPLELDSLIGSGELNATVSGPLDSLKLQAKLTMNKTGIPGVSVTYLDLVADGELIGEETHFQATGNLSGILLSDSVIDTVALSLDYTDSLSTFNVEMKTGEEYAVVSSGALVVSDTLTYLDLTALDIDFLERKWQLQNDDARVFVRDTGYEFSNLVLNSGNQTLTLAGVIAPDGQNSFHIALENVDVADYDFLLAGDIGLSGIFSFEVSLNGTFAKPDLRGKLDFVNGKYLDVPFERFGGDFGYRDELFTWDFNLAKTGSDSLLETSAQLPIRLTLSPYEMTFLEEVPLEFKISTRGLDLSFLQAITPSVTNIRGTLVADIVLSNSLKDLRGVGPIRLINGECAIPEYGLKYEQANLVLVLNQKQLVIRDFSMRSGDGYLRALEGSLSLSQDRVEAFSSRIKLKNFQLVNSKQIQARAEGEVILKGSIQSPEFGGSLTVDECKIFYDTFEEETQVSLTSQPYFVISTDTVSHDTTGAMRFQKKGEFAEFVFMESDFYKSLHGEISLYFPRNVWVRSSDTAIEIEGDVALVKEVGPDFVLFGSFSTLRGFYELLGNRFQVDKGEMVFNGEPDLNPTVSIEASTIIVENSATGSPTKHEFKVQISGTLFYPEFNFTLDGKVAAQEDIVSIFLFGKTFADRPGFVGGSGTAANGDDKSTNTGLDDRAKGLIAGQLLKQLSGRVGQRLRLDVIQIESGGSLSDAKVRVGKYVTPDVFVSVSQDFGAEGNQIVELEYQIPKIWLFNLLLQASRAREGDTGMDLIWKIEW